MRAAPTKRPPFSDRDLQSLLATTLGPEDLHSQLATTGLDGVPVDLPSWRSHMSAVHSWRLASTAPTSVGAVARESERRRQRQERHSALARRGEQASRVVTLSHTAFLGSCASMSASSAAYGASASVDSRRLTATATEALRTLLVSTEAGTVQERDRHIDAALGQLTAAGFSLGDDGVDADDSSLDHLLGVLKKEPSDDGDRAARFELYERHAETVAAIRASLFALWNDARVELADEYPAPCAAVNEMIRKLDDRGNLEVEECRHYWFVYSMARATARNEAMIRATLTAIRSKIALLADEEGRECPICLEPIGGDASGGAAGSVTLGCFHKLHEGCWRQWSAQCASVRKVPFCPTCRSDDFLEEILH